MAYTVCIYCRNDILPNMSNPLGTDLLSEKMYVDVGSVEKQLIDKRRQAPSAKTFRSAFFRFSELARANLNLPNTHPIYHHVKMLREVYVLLTSLPPANLRMIVNGFLANPRTRAPRASSKPRSPN